MRIYTLAKKSHISLSPCDLATVARARNVGVFEVRVGILL